MATRSHHEELSLLPVVLPVVVAGATWLGALITRIKK